MEETYAIYSSNGGKFCERTVDNDGNVQLKTKNCTIRLEELQQKAYNSHEARKTRQKVKRHPKKDV